MIPGAMSDKLTDLARVAQGGPMYAKFAERVMTQLAEAPEKEAARKARQQEKLTKKLQRGQTTDDGKPVDPKPDP